uniref:SCAN box domain-containing protein n=1 Tax=Pygocentrus nattereri TaxID=42514 RepID=A0AAR2J3W0_PYGNA
MPPKSKQDRGAVERRELEQAMGQSSSEDQISAETYRQRFRVTDIWPDDTPQELYVRLKELFAKWTKPEEHTVQQMSEILILEQFMRMVSPDMAVWIKEHDPGTAEEAAWQRRKGVSRYQLKFVVYMGMLRFTTQ